MVMEIGQWSKILNSTFLIKSARTRNKWNKINESHVKRMDLIISYNNIACFNIMIVIP